MIAYFIWLAIIALMLIIIALITVDINFITRFIRRMQNMYFQSDDFLDLLLILGIIVIILALGGCVVLGVLENIGTI